MNVDKQLRLLLISLIIAITSILYGYTFVCAQDQAGSMFAWARVMVGRPPLIRFTGTFFVPGEVPEDTRKSRTFNVFVARGKEWVFHIEQARNLSWPQSEHKILADIWPRSLYFIGRKEVLKQLQDIEISGKSFVVLGYLYKNGRNFHVTEVQDPSQE